MTQLRKWLFAAMTALALTVPAVTASPAHANPPPARQGQTRWYHVYARVSPDDPWYDIGAYDNYNDARTVAIFVIDLGYQAFVR